MAFCVQSQKNSKQTQTGRSGTDMPRRRRGDDSQIDRGETGTVRPEIKRTHEAFAPWAFVEGIQPRETARSLNPRCTRGSDSSSMISGARPWCAQECTRNRSVCGEKTPTGSHMQRGVRTEDVANDKFLCDPGLRCGRVRSARRGHRAPAIARAALRWPISRRPMTCNRRQMVQPNGGRNSCLTSGMSSLDWE
jgi:hypothetical protein